MNQKQMTLEEVVALLKNRQGGRTQRAYAEELGITQAYLSELFRGGRHPGDKVLQKLGLVRREVYEQAV